MFWIVVLPEDENPIQAARPGSRFGEIRIGDFVEKFEMPVSFWAPQEYRKHWQAALDRIIFVAQKSCLVTSMVDPRHANFIVWWPIYREGSSVIFQNQILFMDKLDSPFNPQDPFVHIQDRRVIAENGTPLSEWSVHISEIEDFLIH